MKKRALLISAFLMLLAGCRRQASIDRENLDGLLSTSRIDRIVFVSPPPQRTNILTGSTADRFLRSLNKANRIDAADATKDQVQADVQLASGTNHICWLSLYDNGIWKFGDYSFRLHE